VVGNFAEATRTRLETGRHRKGEVNVFAVKSEVLKKLLANPEWSIRLEKAETMRDVERVLREFCEAKGFKIVQLEKSRQM